MIHDLHNENPPQPQPEIAAERRFSIKEPKGVRRPCARPSGACTGKVVRSVRRHQALDNRLRVPECASLRRFCHGDRRCVRQEFSVRRRTGVSAQRSSSARCLSAPCCKRYRCRLLMLRIEQERVPVPVTSLIRWEIDAEEGGMLITPMNLMVLHRRPPMRMTFEASLHARLPLTLRLTSI